MTDAGADFLVGLGVALLVMTTALAFEWIIMRVIDAREKEEE